MQLYTFYMLTYTNHRLDTLHDILVDVKGKSRTNGHRPLNAKATTAAKATKCEAELCVLYVVVLSAMRQSLYHV